MSQVLDAVAVAPTTSTTRKPRKTRSHKNDSLIGPTDKTVDAKAREALITARVVLVMKHPFFGNLATRLKLTNADEWCGTAATDGVHLYYNSRFIMKLRTKEVQFLVAHEIMHLVYDHLNRRDERNPQIWNIAGDYTINADLKRHKIGEFITTVPCLYETKYDGKSADEIYADLMKNAQKINIDDLIDQLLDDHMDGADEEDGAGEGRPQMTPEERERARQEMKQAIISAAQGAKPGELPSGVERLVETIANPTMNWRELIETTLTSAVRNDFSWMRVSRRGWDLDAIMPGMTPGELIEVDIAIDMSGSISAKQAQAFLGEIAGMIGQFDGYRLHVFSFDTQVYNPQNFTSDNMDVITDYVPQGGGGTSAECIYDYLKSEGRVPTRLVVFTDGYVPNWGDENYTDTVWIIHGDASRSIKPSHGTWAYLEDGDL
jgi:predicted metal-dependent peptidase